MGFSRLRLFRFAWPQWLADAALRRAFQTRGKPPSRNRRAMAYWLKAGANPNQQRFGGADTWLFVHVAADEGDAEALQLLLNHGAQIDPVATPHRETPIAMALRQKHRACAEALARAGAQLDHACRFAYSSLDAASLEDDWFRLYPARPRAMRQSFQVQSGYRTSLPAKGAFPAPSRHVRHFAPIPVLRLACVDEAKAIAFSQNGVCEPTVRALMHNLGWEDLVEVSKACEQGRQLEAAWVPPELPIPSAPAPSRARL